jgi:hypothetical protein
MLTSKFEDAAFDEAEVGDAARRDALSFDYGNQLRDHWGVHLERDVQVVPAQLWPTNACNARPLGRWS